ncbi:hypothetical protein CL653_01330 [bacterium]|mgnify:CR=1 FL=1|nr:hypothetical protein [bacterium]
MWSLEKYLQGILYACLFAVLFVPLIVSPELFFPYITGKNIWFRVLVELAVAAWLCLCLIDTKFRPRPSAILTAFLTFLAVMFVANLFGEYAPKSFWSNYERMEGYIMLVHVALFFLLLGSVLDWKKNRFISFKISTWDFFLHVSLVAATLVAFTALWQLLQSTSTTDWRLSGTLGNPTYMAVYMLFNIFIATWFIFQDRFQTYRPAYIFLLTTFVFLLVQTATRGAIVGLSVGVFAGSLFLLLRANSRAVKKGFLIILLLLVSLVSLFTIFRDSHLIQSNLILQRATNINYQALEVRFDLWQVAWKGVEARPILGWGQANFNYVFNTYYDPQLANVERWYDRAHNVFLDWLIAGGLLGLLAYLSLFATALWYILRKESSFTTIEQGLLLGIVVAYLTQNLVVFDNLVSYIYFAVLLAFIHSRVGKEAKSPVPVVTSRSTVYVSVASILVFALVLAYSLNASYVQAGQDLIQALSHNDTALKMEKFQLALSRDPHTKQEIVEQLMIQSGGIFSDPDVPVAEKTRWAIYAHEVASRFLMEKPNDARLHLLASQMYRSMGDFDEARRQVTIARELSPNKIDIILEQGWTEYHAGNIKGLIDHSTYALELNPGSRDAQRTYAISVLIDGNDQINIRDIFQPEKFWRSFASSNDMLSLVLKTAHFDLAIEMVDYRLQIAPDSMDNWLNKVSVLVEAGKTEEAITTLDDLLSRNLTPLQRTTIKCYKDNLLTGVDVTSNCYNL